MSDLRIGLVAEGPTDAVVIQSVLRSTLQGRPFVLTQIFPEESLVFGALGTGWAGVYRWCHQSSRRGAGRLSNDRLIFQQFDILVLHLDADVADHRYEQGSITPLPTDGPLPCAANCPPASDTTGQLRQVLLSWCGETAVPPYAVICMPSKSTEAWVIASLFPADGAMAQGIECYPNPEARLGQQKKTKRLNKTRGDYLANATEIEHAWHRLVSPDGLGEATRFEADVRSVLPQQQA